MFHINSMSRLICGVATVSLLLVTLGCTPSQNQKTEGATSQEGVSGNPTITTQSVTSNSNKVSQQQVSGITAVSVPAPAVAPVTPPSAQISTSISTITSSSATVISGSLVTVTVTAKDSAGANILSGVNVAVSVSGGTSTGTLSAVTNNFDGTFTATYTGILSGTAQTISATLNGSVITSTQPTITVNPGSASRIFVTGPSSGYTMRCVGPFTATFKDVAGNVAPLSGSKTINLVDSLSGTFYSSIDCSGTSVTSLAAVTGNSFKTFSLLPSWTQGSSSVSATDSVAALTSGNISVAMTSSIGMIGSGYTNAYANTTGIAVRSRYDGGFNYASGLALDGSGNIYISEYSGAKMSKWNLTTQVETGWVGAVSSGLAATGGATGCTTASNAKTPGWCLGGLAYNANTTVDNLTNPSRVYVTGGYAYVSDFGRHRIMKYDASTGAVVGWIGRIATVPTGGVAGCTTAVVGAFTPGWCTGGNSSAGTGNGMLTSPRGMSGDGTYLYVADGGNHRIVRYNLSTGAFGGWIGRIATVATGGAAGCTTAAVNASTPGWCTGGTAATGNGNFQFNTPYGIWIDSTRLYVADYSNSRIQRITMSGALTTFSAWMGVSSTTKPSGGAAGCTTAAAGAYMNLWCSGGISTTANTDGGINGASSVWGDATYLYVTDYNNHRINRYNKSTAASAGWIGLVRTSPTGGDPGCITAMPFGPTPGWCSGGVSAAGHTLGTYYQPYEVIGDGTNLYIADAGNNRVQFVSASSGAAASFMGGQSQQQSAWVSTASVAALGSFDDTSIDSSYGVAVSGNDLYVTETVGHRLKKFNATAGTFTGWVGKALAPPSGGDASCSSIAPTALAQKWCTGGSASSGSSDGQFNAPGSIYVYNGNVYVADTNNHRIERYTTAGLYSGWIGFIGASPTGGDINCAGASNTTYTLGWCTGGSATSVTSGAGFNLPQGITGDGTYLYVTDRGIHRIQKINMTTGAHVGWVGMVATSSPTGGASGCTTTAVNTATPGWCRGGGGSGAGSGDGRYNTPYGISYSGSELFVADVSNNRIAKINASTGVFTGWSGRINSVTGLGGGTGCNGAISGAATPAWCTGGTTQTGTGNGQMNGPRAVWADGTTLYIADSANGRIQKINQSTGAFIGWFGRVSSSPTAGPAGCIGAASGTITPNWCSAGTSRVGPGLGAFDLPYGITADANWVYVTDFNQNRVVRIKP